MHMPNAPVEKDDQCSIQGSKHMPIEYSWFFEVVRLITGNSFEIEGVYHIFETITSFLKSFPYPRVNLTVCISCSFQGLHDIG